MLSDSLFIHTAVLPTLNLTLYEALVADLPLCGNALDFVHADANHVNNIVREISMLTQNDEIHHASFADYNMIYRVSIAPSSCDGQSDNQRWTQRLIVYIFAHMMFCTEHERSGVWFGDLYWIL